MKFIEIFKESAFSDVKRPVGAEFPAAETANTAVVIENESAVFDGNGFWRAGLDTYPA